jgi:cyclohexa-1,5-dienecarbonyl-CoA hydratase
MSDYEHIATSIEGGVATITLARPPVNVLNIPMMAELNEAMESCAARTDLAAIALRANGKAFSAGVDVADHTPDKVADMIRLFHGIFRTMASTDALTVACVNGAALGGGCELACFCDVVLASEKAKFGQPEVQVGVFPPVAAAILPTQIGVRKAVEMVALGGTIRADEALRIGLVSHVYSVDGFDESVDEYLAAIDALSHPVVRMAKRATVTPNRGEILAHLDEAERIYLNELMDIGDAHEGIAAFLEKRAPQWAHA